SWLNDGTIDLNDGPSFIHGNLTNLAGRMLTVSNSAATFYGRVLNQGTVRAHAATVTFASNYTENAALIADAADFYFTNLTVGATGYLIVETASRIFLAGNFTNASTQNVLWNTVPARFAFLTGGPHRLELAGI